MVGFGKCRFVHQGLPIAAHGLFIFRLGIPDVAQVVVGDGIIRLEADSFLKEPGRLVPLALPRKG
jgi:hypothetical protein